MRCRLTTGLTDSYLLAWFAEVKPRQKASTSAPAAGYTRCGAGGSLRWWLPQSKYKRGGRNDKAVGGARGVGDRVTIHHADLRDWKRIIKPGSQDLVAINPPYYPRGSGKLCESAAARIARHEGEGCSFLDAACAAYGLLKTGGRFCFCHKPERLDDILKTLDQARLAPKRLVFAHHSPKSEPWLFLCEARKGASKGIKVLPPFISTDYHGNPTEEYLSVYKPKGNDVYAGQAGFGGHSDREPFGHVPARGAGAEGM